MGSSVCVCVRARVGRSELDSSARRPGYLPHVVRLQTPGLQTPE
eukprot:NODE_13978_length_198_cov_22.536913_g12208_i0.p3 GENE.NODE_13978_length_198_cov_22.536913_g12208_i0~~NODE_13978_length_198_cov_22.536913_g12208_i0.p3  ORF type:complete len:51 (-),score=10.87 NODE_13978_length_198_cov_22.536913_g12208_i0:46-177(-)